MLNNIPKILFFLHFIKLICFILAKYQNNLNLVFLVLNSPLRMSFFNYISSLNLKIFFFTLKLSINSHLILAGTIVCYYKMLKRH